MKMVKGATTAVLLGCALFFFMPLPAQANELNIAPYCARAGCLHFVVPSIIYKAVEIRISHILWYGISKTEIPTTENRLKSYCLKANCGLPHREAIFLNTGLPVVEFGLDTVTFGSINNIKQIEQSI